MGDGSLWMLIMGGEKEYQGLLLEEGMGACKYCQNV